MALPPVAVIARNQEIDAGERQRLLDRMRQRRVKVGAASDDPISKREDADRSTVGLGQARRSTSRSILVIPTRCDALLHSSVR
jgi:hypothetical protein